MNLQTTISIFAGGPGSGCHGENCGRPQSLASDKQQDKADELLRMHDEIKDHPFRTRILLKDPEKVSSIAWRILYEEQQSSLEDLLKEVHRAALDQKAKEYVRYAKNNLAKAESVAEGEGDHEKATFAQERALMALHEAITQLGRYPSAIRAATRKIPVKGFTPQQEQQIRQVLRQIPGRFLFGIKKIVSAPELGAKHGRYVDQAKIIHLNPRDFENKTEFGQGVEKKLPHVDLTLAHEVGHYVFLRLPRSQQDAWRALSGWKEGSDPQQAPPYKEKRPGWPKETSTETHHYNAKFTRRYAERNSDEDFADSFGFFVMGQQDRVPDEKRAFLESVLR